MLPRDALLFVVVAFVVAAIPMVARSSTPQPNPKVRVAAAPPTHWEEVPLRPLPLTPYETELHARFPGHVARYRAGSTTILWRQTERATRRLHSAYECYRGLGYRVTEPRLVRDSGGDAWQEFLATPPRGPALRVREHIQDATGRTWTDLSAWYWHARWNPDAGPWIAIATATPHSE